MLANTTKYAGAPQQCMTNSEDCAEKSLTVDNNEETGRALVVYSDEQRDKNEASGSCSDLQLGRALHKPRSQAVRFTDEVKQYL